MSKQYPSQPLRVENFNLPILSTSKCIRDELWFVNNKKLEERILAFIGKYQKECNVTIYAFQLMGNHAHICANFPDNNSARFFQHLNARIAEAVRIYVDNFEEGGVFKKRPCHQYLPLEEDALDSFIYCALQPINHGLAENLSDYPGYCFFHDAVRERPKKASWLCYKEYNEALRKDPKASKADFYKEEEIKFTRLPGYEDLTKSEYQKLIKDEYRLKRAEMIAKRKGKPFLGKEQLRKIKPGSKPLKPKKGGNRPIVKSRCSKESSRVLSTYESQVEEQREGALRYMAGDFTFEYPAGMYRPAGHSISPPGGQYLDLMPLR